MKTEEYRDLIAELNRKASDLQACVNDDERTLWIPHAEKLRFHAWAVADACNRATPDDKSRMQAARARLDAAYDSVRHLMFGNRKILGM